MNAETLLLDELNIKDICKAVTPLSVRIASFVKSAKIVLAKILLITI